MGVDDILDGARADLKAEEQRWNERFEREKGRRKRAEVALEERPTAAELEEANEARARLESEVARLRAAHDGSPSPSDARRLEREIAELRRENDGLRADVAAHDSEIARRKEQKRELQAAYRDKLDEVEALGRALEGVTPALYAALKNQPTAHVDAALLNADVAEDLNAARGAKTPRGPRPKTPRVVSADVGATTKERRHADDTGSRRRRDDDAAATTATATRARRSGPRTAPRLRPRTRPRRRRHPLRRPRGGRYRANASCSWASSRSRGRGRRRASRAPAAPS